MKQISSSIADFYIKRNIIKQDEKEIYQYGFELILNDVITFGLILLLSVLFWNVRYAIEFLAVFCLTRIYCGGYHASKSYICRITMITIFCCIYLITAVILSLNPAILYFLLFFFSSDARIAKSSEFFRFEKKVQYSSGLKFRISRSRSTIRRSVTD